MWFYLGTLSIIFNKSEWMFKDNLFFCLIHQILIRNNTSYSSIWHSVSLPNCTTGGRETYYQLIQHQTFTEVIWWWNVMEIKIGPLKPLSISSIIFTKVYKVIYKVASKNFFELINLMVLLFVLIFLYQNSFIKISKNWGRCMYWSFTLAD